MTVALDPDDLRLVRNSLLLVAELTEDAALAAQIEALLERLPREETEVRGQD